MLPRKHRLLKSEDFKNTSLKGSYFSFQNISIKASRNNLAFSRIGFSIGKTISQKAVERNRVKRVLRETFHHLLLRIVPGVDIVVYFKKDNRSEKLIDTKKTHFQIESLLNKAKLLK